MAEKKPTEKQVAARKRNWAIRQIRAYYHLCPPLVSPEARKKIEGILDEELKRLGAETEAERTEKAWEEFKSS